MKPQYIRVVIPPNNNLAFNAPTPSAIRLSVMPPGIHRQMPMSSVQLLHRFTPSPTPMLPTRVILTSPPSTVCLPEQMMPSTTNDLTTQASMNAILLNQPLSSIGKPVSYPNCSEASAITNTGERTVPKNLPRSIDSEVWWSSFEVNESFRSTSSCT